MTTWAHHALVKFLPHDFELIIDHMILQFLISRLKLQSDWTLETSEIMLWTQTRGLHNVKTQLSNETFKKRFYATVRISMYLQVCIC